MATQFLHGAKVTESFEGVVPFRLGRSGTIGLIGTAVKGPVNIPKLVSGPREGAEVFGVADGLNTIPDALNAIFSQQKGGQIVVVRVPQGLTATETKSNVIGGVSEDGNYTGVSAWLTSASATLEGDSLSEGLVPKILIAPGWGHDIDVIGAMLPVANKLRSVIIADGPNTSRAAAKAWREQLADKRIFAVDPGVLVWDTVINDVKAAPASGFVAGLIARNDIENGWWTSPSNKIIYGINGTARPISWIIDDYDCEANILNEVEVATIIRDEGYYLWGNRTLSPEPRMPFLNQVRIGDMLDEVLLKAAKYFMDKNLGRGLTQNIKESLTAFLDSMRVQNAIIGYDIWYDPEKNAPAATKNGELWIDYSVTLPVPLENFQVARIVTDRHWKTIFSTKIDKVIL